MMDLVEFSIERGNRLFSNEKNNKYRHLVVQFKLKLNEKNKELKLILKSINKEVVFNYKVDFIKKSIFLEKSHEDPLIIINENGNKYILLCIQLDEDLIKNFGLNSSIKASILTKDIIIFNESFVISNDILKYIKEDISIVLKDKFSIFVENNGILRFHMGKKSEYKEIERRIKAKTILDFEDYFLDCVYFGIQSSYKINNINFEDKLIIIGQKGIYESGIHIATSKSYPIIPFNETYQKTINQEVVHWKEINKISDLISYYDDKNIVFFETNLNFVVDTYKEKNTYGFDVFTVNKPNGKYHIDLNICRDCKNASKCLQIVPSGLSYQLLKNNISIENSTDCKIYKLCEKNSIWKNE